MKECIIIQARLSSTRYPGKVLKPFFKGKSILETQLETVSQFCPDIPLVVATSLNSADDELEAFCVSKNVTCFRGNEDDVLDRFIMCAEKFGAQKIIRICSDNPFLIGASLLDLIAASRKSELDYLSFQNSEQIPAIKTHWGLFAEVVNFSALQTASVKTAERLYHEHVTNYIYGHPEMFRVKLLNAPKEVFKRNDLRLTIDTPIDFEVAQTLYPLWDKKSLKNLIDLVDANATLKQSMKVGIDQFSK